MWGAGACRPACRLEEACRAGSMPDRRGAPKWVILPLQHPSRAAPAQQQHASTGQHSMVSATASADSYCRTCMPAATAQRRQQLSTRPTAARPHGEPRGLGAGALDADGLHWGSMLDQCTAWNSSQVAAPSRRASGSAWAAGPSCRSNVARAGLYRESCATNDERREPAPGPRGGRMVRYIGDSCGRSGGFFCVPFACVQPRALKRAPPTVEDPGRPTGTKKSSLKTK